jgi:hypothetical protein
MAITRVIQEDVLGCRTVAFDEHAIRRMSERKISEEEVLDVLRFPDRTDLKADYGRKRYRKTFASGGRVDVIFEQDPTQIVVFSTIRGS